MAQIILNIQKKFAFAIIGFLAVLIVGSFVYAYTSSPGTVPNPGHALTSIQGYFAGDGDLGVSLGKLCQADGTNCQASGGGINTATDVKVIENRVCGGVSQTSFVDLAFVPKAVIFNCIQGSGSVTSESISSLPNAIFPGQTVAVNTFSISLANQRLTVWCQGFTGTADCKFVGFR